MRHIPATTNRLQAIVTRRENYIQPDRQ
jgi:hypothetical protein